MNMIVLGIQGKRAFGALLFSLSLMASTASGMIFGTKWPYPGEWDEEKVLNECLATQNYEEAFKYVRYYIGVKQLPAATDWLKRATYHDFHVPCMYERFRWFVQSHSEVAPSKACLENVLAWIIIAIVLTKADVDCCTKLYHLFKDDRDNPFDLLIKNYDHRLHPGYRILYKDILRKAFKIFNEGYKGNRNIVKSELPLPIWVCTVSNNSYASQWIDFGGTADDIKKRAALKDTYSSVFKLAEVKTTRKASMATTWSELETLRDWDEFFALRMVSFPDLVVGNDFSKSTIQLLGDKISAIDMGSNKEGNDDQSNPAGEQQPVFESRDDNQNSDNPDRY